MGRSHPHPNRRGPRDRNGDAAPARAPACRMSASPECDRRRTSVKAPAVRCDRETLSVVLAYAAARMDSPRRRAEDADSPGGRATLSDGPVARAQEDDLATRVLMRTVGRLSPGAGATVAISVFLILGVALPVLIRSDRAGTIALGTLGALLAVVVLLADLLAAQQANHRRLLVEWTSDLRKLDATEFEWLVGEVLRREGWTITETGRPDRADGNVDLRASRAGQRLLVQCKRWQAKPVGVDEVRKIAGTASAEQPAEPVLVTLSTFTADARAEAPKLRVQLVEGRDLLQRIEGVRRSEPCPSCNTPMILDRSSRGWWLRCPRYPSCTGKQDLSNEPGTAVDLLLHAG